MNATSGWYFSFGGQQFGPVPRFELEQRSASGALPPDTLVWTDGMSEWEPLGRHIPPALHPAPAVAPPTQPIHGPPAPPANGSPAAPQATPPRARTRPTSLSVFGIINIVFGFFGLLCAPFGIISSFGPSTATVLSGEGVRAFTIASSLLGFILSGFLLTLGIGLLRMQNWARTGSVIYGWLTIAKSLVSIGVILYFIVPHLSHAQGAGMAEAIGGIVGGVFGGLFSMIYPILLIIFMQRPIARAACGNE